MKSTLACCAVALLHISMPAAKVIDFEIDAGAMAEKNDEATWWANGKALNATLASLQPGDTLVIPNKTFFVMGGVKVDNVKSVTIQIEGTIKYAANMKQWPRKEPIQKVDHLLSVLHCWGGDNWENVTFSSSGMGIMHGQGATWWGLPGVGYLSHGENRPKLINLNNAKNILFEKILFKDSPYWTFDMYNIDGLEVRYCSIDVRRTTDDGHGTIDMTAFNTDGFDVSGRNVWIHDSSVWNQDDCLAVKAHDGVPSENMLFERIEASGLGLTIGSIGAGSVVRNITFRDIHMHKTVKGIYSKFRAGPANVTDITFENIVMDEPQQYAIWIGPAQQSDSSNLCAAHPCSICWPKTPFSKCNAPDEGFYSNILLKNITVNSALKSPGLLMGGKTTPMRGVVFEDVKFNNPGSSPFGQNYKCDNVADGVARGSTFPVPACFKDETGTCVGDGGCSQDGLTCCSKTQHSTDNCGSGARCGCVAQDECATHESDCCTGKGHKTAKCSFGIGFRCDGANELIV